MVQEGMCSQSWGIQGRYGKLGRVFRHETSERPTWLDHREIRGKTGFNERLDAKQKEFVGVY